MRDTKRGRWPKLVTVIAVAMVAAFGTAVGALPAAAATNPHIDNVSGTCTADGTKVVQVTGTGFTLGSVTATIGGQTTPITLSATSPATQATVSCLSLPASFLPTTLPLQITVGDLQSNSLPVSFTLANIPSITSISPASAPASGSPVTPVTITGENFQGATSVAFGTTTVTANDLTISSDGTTITVYAPAHPADVVDVTVTTPDGTATSADAFRFIGTAKPTITAIDPVKGPAGTVVTITGSGFAALTGVTFEGVASTNIHVSSDTSLTATVPGGLDAGPVDVAVTTSNGAATDAGAFEFTTEGAPTIATISPKTGAPGASVAILGTGFTGVTGAAGVTFGGINAVYTVNSDTSITATAPSGMPEGDVDVVITNAVGSSSITANSTFTNTQGPIATITLQGRFTLIGWLGADNMAVGDALRGGPDGPTDGTNDITSKVASIWSYDSANQKWLGYFPSATNPGANDLQALRFGAGYFVALADPSAGNVDWKIARGVSG